MTKEESTVKAEAAAKDATRNKEKTGRQRRRHRDKVKSPTKIIIRHLPPTMSEEEFLKQIDPLPAHDFYYFAAADWSLGFDATCRAYITLKNYEDVFLFRDRFDGYVFVDSKGVEYPAIVEFAPFQGLLKSKSRRSDNKANSIETESHYQQFLAKLEEEREAASKGAEVKLEFTLGKKEEKITSTPLLQYLAMKKEKRREESKRRTEEKKRQREEEKERKNQAQVTKIITGQDAARADKRQARNSNELASESGAAAAAGVVNSKDKGSAAATKAAADGGEVKMNSRSKRRAERDRRRREEHERKREAEKALKNNENLVQKSLESHVKKEDKPQGDDNKAARKDDKLTNAGNERRERNRNRNRNRDKERQKDKEQRNATYPYTQEQAKIVEIMKAPKSDDVGNAEAVSESVKSFIFSVANVKEFIPKHKQLEQAAKQQQIEAETATSTDNDLQQVKQQLEKLALYSQDTGDGRAMECTAEERALQRQRSAEERRIRNKDRPSIAIYQPKMRTRASEESDSKDLRSNPPSDCESVKKDEQRKKVSRYSERRAGDRRSKEKVMKSGDELNKSAEYKSEISAANPVAENVANKIENEQRAENSD